MDPDENEYTLCDACGASIAQGDAYDGPDGEVLCIDCLLDTEEG